MTPRPFLKWSEDSSIKFLLSGGNFFTGKLNDVHKEKHILKTQRDKEKMCRQPCAERHALHGFKYADSYGESVA